jgi:protein-L-isoaspartate(D-aspartate) O-methyltransferase
VGNNQQDMHVIVRVGENDYKNEKHGKFMFVPLLKGTVNF